MDYPETTPPGDSSHNQPPNADTIAREGLILKLTSVVNFN